MSLGSYLFNFLLLCPLGSQASSPFMVVIVPWACLNFHVMSSVTPWERQVHLFLLGVLTLSLSMGTAKQCVCTSVFFCISFSIIENSVHATFFHCNPRAQGFLEFSPFLHRCTYVPSLVARNQGPINLTYLLSWSMLLFVMKYPLPNSFPSSSSGLTPPHPAWALIPLCGAPLLALLGLWLPPPPHTHSLWAHIDEATLWMDAFLTSWGWFPGPGPSTWKPSFLLRPWSLGWQPPHIQALLTLLSPKHRHGPQMPEPDHNFAGTPLLPCCNIPGLLCFPPLPALMTTLLTHLTAFELDCSGREEKRREKKQKCLIFTYGSHHKSLRSPELQGSNGHMAPWPVRQLAAVLHLSCLWCVSSWYLSPPDCVGWLNSYSSSTQYSLPGYGRIEEHLLNEYILEESWLMRRGGSEPSSKGWCCG